VAAAFVVSGCFGPFNLTRRLYNWNEQVGQKWEREIAFLLLALTPVYFATTLADAIVFNSMEFWTGSNPVDPPTSSRRRSSLPNTRHLVRGDEAVKMSRYDAPGYRALTLEFFQAGVPNGGLQFERRDGQPTVARDVEGRVLFRAQTLLDGSVLVSDSMGREVALYSADQVEHLLK